MIVKSTDYPWMMDLVLCWELFKDGVTSVGRTVIGSSNDEMSMFVQMQKDMDIYTLSMEHGLNIKMECSCIFEEDAREFLESIMLNYKIPSSEEEMVKYRDCSFHKDENGRIFRVPYAAQALRYRFWEDPVVSTPINARGVYFF